MLEIYIPFALVEIDRFRDLIFSIMILLLLPEWKKIYLFWSALQGKESIKLFPKIMVAYLRSLGRPKKVPFSYKTVDLFTKDKDFFKLFEFCFFFFFGCILRKTVFSKRMKLWLFIVINLVKQEPSYWCRKCHRHILFLLTFWANFFSSPEIFLGSCSKLTEHLFFVWFRQ